jgi:acyl carrier protein
MQSARIERRSMKRTEFVEGLCQALMAEPDQVKEATPLASLAGWDSMGQVTTVAFIDDAVDMSLAPGALQKCVTVGDIVSLVASRLDG